MISNFDTAIIGGTVEGYTAAVYCSKAGLKTLLIESSNVSNSELDELKLIHRLKNRAHENGCVVINAQVYSLECKMMPKVIHASTGTFSCKAIILAMGLVPNKLGVPLENMLHGCGLHYHHACTISYLKNRTIVIFGNNELAVSQAITLSALSKKVYLIYPDGTLICNKKKLQVLKETDNIVSLCKCIIYGLRKSHGHLVGIDIVDKTTGNTSSLDCQLLYILNSQIPNSNLCRPYISTDKRGYILTDDNLKTNVPGIFATGQIKASFFDERSSSFYQKELIMAASDGALAAINVSKYINCIN